MAFNIGEAFGWSNNPLYQTLSTKRNALMGFGAGLASGTDFGQGVANGLQGAAQGAARDDALAILEAERVAKETENNATAAWVKQNFPQYGDLPPLQGFQLATAEMNRQAQGPDSNLMSVGGHLYDTSTGQWISPPETAGNRQNVSLSGQWGQDAQGNPVFLQPSSTGELVQAQVPDGVTLLGPYDVNADKAAGTAFGRNTGGAQFDLPGVALSTEQTLKAIQDVRSESAGMNEQFGKGWFGLPTGQTLPAIAGTEKANFQVANDRLVNRAFLEAREVLRGGGQITDFESQKAEGAITNIEDAIKRGDQALYERALNDFEQAVKDGYAKLQAQAGQMGGYGGARPQSGGDWVDAGNGVRIRELP